MITIGEFDFDAAIHEDHTLDNEVTEYPVESGGDVADHVRNKPIVYAVEGVVSDSPLGEMIAKRALLNQSTLGLADRLPSEAARAYLEQLREEKRVVDIQSTTRRYKNMMMQSLAFPVTATDGESLHFHATFKEIRFVSNARTTVKVAVPRAAKKANKGALTSKAAGTQTPTETNTAWLKDFGNWIRKKDDSDLDAIDQVITPPAK